MRRLVWCSITALLMLTACAAAEEQHLEPGSASCEAHADHEIALCPLYGGARLGNILRCEEDRVHAEHIGCGEAMARYVLCATNASGYDCEQGPEECEDEMERLRVCRQRFAQQTGCSRVPRDDVCIGQPQPYAYNCIGDGPDGCGPDIHEQTEAQQILNVGFRCCPSFASEGVSYFSDPELGPDELPPDYSAIDFSDRDACLAFSDEQAWGTCEESSGCACDRCATEIETCANDYACIVVRRCTLHGDCSPGNDPFFTGYGSGAQHDDELSLCLEESGCGASCNMQL